MEQELEKKLKEISLENENWKPCPEFENKYLISNYGRILGIGTYNTCKKYDLIKQHKKNGRNGYMQVRLYDNGRARTIETHTLVAKAFIPNPNNLPMVNHKDEDKTNNKVSNLEWCDNKYNIRYSNSRAVDVYTLDGNKIDSSNCLADISEKYKVPTSNISRSCKCSKYNEVYKKYQFRYKGDLFIPKPIVDRTPSGRRRHLGQYSKDHYYKKIYLFNTKGNLIREFKTVSEASEYLQTSTSNVCKCCSGKINTIKGFITLYDIDGIIKRMNKVNNRLHKTHYENVV